MTRLLLSAMVFAVGASTVSAQQEEKAPTFITAAGRSVRTELLATAGVRVVGSAGESR